MRHPRGGPLCIRPLRGGKSTSNSDIFLTTLIMIWKQGILKVIGQGALIETIKPDEGKRVEVN